MGNARSKCKAPKTRPFPEEVHYLQLVVVFILVVFFVTETHRLEPLKKGFHSKSKHAARVGGEDRE